MNEKQIKYLRLLGVVLLIGANGIFALLGDNAARTKVTVLSEACIKYLVSTEDFGVPPISCHREFTYLKKRLIKKLQTINEYDMDNTDLDVPEDNESPRK